MQYKTFEDFLNEKHIQYSSINHKQMLDNLYESYIDTINDQYNSYEYVTQNEIYEGLIMSHNPEKFVTHIYNTCEKILGYDIDEQTYKVNVYCKPEDKDFVIMEISQCLQVMGYYLARQGLHVRNKDIYWLGYEPKYDFISFKDYI